MLDIQLSLDQWRKNRQITSEQQIKGYAGNITEELAELLRAINSNNEHEIIDALCDLAVYTMNLRLLKDKDILCLNVLIDNNTIQYENYLELLKVVIDHSTLMIRLGVDLSIRNKIDNKEIELLTYLTYIFNTISYLGYNPKECMKEVLKEINDRIGYWDEDIKKFVKYKKDDLYKADFTKCKKV